MNIIVAASENNVIGNKGTMPWHLSADLKYFKQTTMGHAVIMGRKTFQSIGRALPGRRNIVITRQPDFVAPEGVEVFGSLADAIAAAPDDAFVIGGGEIYNQAWALADAYYVTRVHTTISEFDTTIPPVPAGCELVKSESVSADEKNDFDVTFEVWKRVKK
ncbi:MAG: dihydrofolate reductase [Bacteroidales bacterium]|jgi:dihydrofolate reductase|nr:dihydrofolate reductase [Bacteroidales bacterium]